MIKNRTKETKRKIFPLGKQLINLFKGQQDNLPFLTLQDGKLEVFSPFFLWISGISSDAFSLNIRNSSIPKMKLKSVSKVYKHQAEITGFLETIF